MNKILVISSRSPLLPDVVTSKDELDIFNFHKGSIKLSCLSTIKVLEENNIDCKLIDPIDIDKNIEEYNPTHVIIHAIWLPPNDLRNYAEKFKNINWIIVSHSEITSLSIERNIIKWLVEYLHIENVSIASVSSRTFADFKIIAESVNLEYSSKVKMLPTLYDLNFKSPKIKQKETGVVDIACFGVIRFLKNQLIQAIAAIEYARRKKVKLRYHITINPPYARNIGLHDIEGFGQILKNIREVFSSVDQEKFQLVEHKWTSREVFKNLVREMDLGLNLSLSESFGLVSTDFVFNNIPVIGSKELFWLPDECIADNTNTEDIVNAMIDVMDNYESKKIYEKTINNLTSWNNQALDHWKKL